jgi:hypothetical protein
MNHHRNEIHSKRSKFIRLLSRAALALESRGASAVSLGLILFIGFCGGFQLAPNGMLCFGLLGVVFFEFQKRLDQGLPLMQVAGILSVLQWVIGPYLSYSTELVEGRYSMYVDEAQYFSFALPGTAAYLLGLLAFGYSIRQKEIVRSMDRRGYFELGIALNVAAVAAGVVGGRAPGGLAFAFHLLSQIGYVGTIYLLFSKSPFRWPLILLSLLQLVRGSAESAMFHDMILWVALMFCYWYGTKSHSTTGKLALLSAVGLGLFSIQAVKEDYRAKVWHGQDASFTGHIIDFWTGNEPVSGDEVLSNVIARLNQGWIISAVMNTVPKSVDYANGETIVDAFYGAFVPRFLAPDKAKAGGQVNFRRFTGLDIADSTSMAISPLGEAYANFGPQGGVALIFGFGMIFSLLYSFCLRYIVKHPAFLFWIPLIFYQAIKAETEFATVLNQLSKGAVVAFGLYWLITKHLMPYFVPPQARRRRPVSRLTDSESSSESRELAETKSASEIQNSPALLDGK